MANFEISLEFKLTYFTKESWLIVCTQILNAFADSVPVVPLVIA